MDAIAIITVLALMQFTYFSFQVGQMRAKHGVMAPSISGNIEFECMFRVQQNTLEQIVVFLPALWMYAMLQNPLWGAAIGAVYIIGRFIYRASYLKDPKSRSLGFMLTLVPSVVLLIGALIGAGRGVYFEYFQQAAG